jgi:hypothetical protein
MNNIDHDRNDTSTVRQAVNTQTGALTDVRPGRQDHFRWVTLNSISDASKHERDKHDPGTELRLRPI